jgi:integrase
MVFRKITKYRDLIKGTPKQHKKWLTDYVLEKRKDVRAQTLSAQLSAIKHFYWINEVEGIDWERVRYYLPEAIKSVDDKPYTHEQIAKLIAACTPKIRIPVYAEAQGGPRVGAFTTMKVGDLSKNSDVGLYRVVVYPGTPDQYVTFFGPEATKEIDEYLDFTRRCGETIAEKSPLIREDFKLKDANKPRSLSRTTIVGQIDRAAIRAGLRSRQKGGQSQRKETMLTHGLRKFFKQQCRRSKVDSIVLEWLIGHKPGNAKVGIEKLMMTYDPAVEDELLKEYLKAVDNRRLFDGRGLYPPGRFLMK